MGRGRDTSILSIGEKKMSDSDYGRSIRSDARIDDLDLELVESFLGDSGASGGGIESLLRLGLIRGQAPDWRITNAALLLFGGAGGRRWHSGAGIRVMRVAGTARVFGQRRNVSSIGHANPPLARAVEKGLQLCMDRCGRSEALRDLLLKDMPEYPAFALREAVVNAVAHRNYERAKSETEVVFYDDRVEVTSPGLLVEGVTVADLSSDEPVHASRNPLLVRALAAAGYMRGDGTGLARLAGAMKESLLKAPRFSARMGSFAIALHNEPVVATAGPGWRHVVGRLGIESDQKRVLLSRPDGFTQQDYRQLNGVTPEVASRGSGIWSTGTSPLPSSSVTIRCRSTTLPRNSIPPGGSWRTAYPDFSGTSAPTRDCEVRTIVRSSKSTTRLPAANSGTWSNWDSCGEAAAAVPRTTFRRQD